VNGKIYVFGGESPERTFNAVEEFNPKTDFWRKMPPMPAARYGLGSTVIGHTIYVIDGGRTPGGSSPTGPVKNWLQEDRM
jgi:N-acetylneuraminic acid mutarotase